MGDLGRCSKHRKCSEFAEGDRVRVVCVAGRSFKGCCDLGDAVGGDMLHQGLTGRVRKTMVERNKHLEYTNPEHSKMGTVSVIFDNGCEHWFVPRALEKVG